MTWMPVVPMFASGGAPTAANLALNAVVFFAGAGAHAVWLKVKAWHGRR